MGLGDVAGSVVPKIAMLAKPRGEGGVSSRYFVPDRCHAAHAATGAICIAGAALIDGTIANDMHVTAQKEPMTVRVEHPKGAIAIGLQARGRGTRTEIAAAFVVRTARPIFMGQILVPATVWPMETLDSKAA
jgi:2-methylaconitate cis-trans-isomerase PrpF